jgi:hypothetical protein
MILKTQISFGPESRNGLGETADPSARGAEAALETFYYAWHSRDAAAGGADYGVSGQCVTWASVSGVGGADYGVSGQCVTRASVSGVGDSFPLPSSRRSAGAPTMSGSAWPTTPGSLPS